MSTAFSRYLGLGTALVAGGVLLVVPHDDPRPAASDPVPAAVAWPKAQRATLPTSLPDGTAYEPAFFVDARTSIGKAPTRDGRSMRLLIRHDTSVRELRRLPAAENPSFQTFTTAGDVLAWAEGTKGDHLSLWSVNLRDGRPPRQLTADTGAAVFAESQYDLVIAEGRLHWVAAAEGGTEVRSVALTGGRVDVRAEAGAWGLSAWPWLVNGATESAGTTALRNLSTGQEVAVPRTRRGATNCSPTWCQVVVLAPNGFTRIDLMHPDGSAREHIAGGAAETVIADVAPLDRFEVLAQTGPNSELTGNAGLRVFEIATKRTVEVSPDAGNVSYRAGVLWWSTGNQDASVWHALDLRTVA